MADTLSFTLAQINPTVGALEANGQKTLEIWSVSKSALVIFPEMALCGYPPEDLVLKPSFIKAIEAQIEVLCEKSADFAAGALIGTPWVIDGKLYNAALLIENGEIVHAQAKHHLPNYGVFDEVRNFSSGHLPSPISYRGAKLGVLICEDMWHADVATHLKEQGADTLISINASPFTQEKVSIRIEQVQARIQETGLPLLYVNQVGGQDELVFDGGSFVMDATGEIAEQLPFFEEAISGDTQKPEINQYEHIYKAVTLGLKDYVEKNGFPGVLIGLSGGVDSALAAALAVDALGADKVHCVMMPSPFTSQDSLDDAQELAKNLGCEYQIISIEKAMTAFEGTIEGLSGTAHENMQSRSRGLILMALSNSSGKMVLSTGNKSEMAVGYATLYGDMCGGFNPLKDLYKQQVYALCEWRNKDGELIPGRIITKAPTAELKDNQKDQDSLPAYDVLDAILKHAIEGRLGAKEIAAEGFEKEMAERVVSMLNRAEYKRRQSPPGVKITSKAFGKDRRYPITNHFKDS